jgi:hypothetical protein
LELSFARFCSHFVLGIFNVFELDAKRMPLIGTFRVCEYSKFWDIAGAFALNCRGFARALGHGFRFPFIPKCWGVAWVW